MFYSSGLNITPGVLVLPINPNLPPSQNTYTTPGTYTWMVPPYVTEVSAVAVGGGGGARGSSSNGQGGGGGGGSGGGNGVGGNSGAGGSVGGSYGGGGGGSDNATGAGAYAGAGAAGAVRIMWGPGRAFPSTNTGDL